MKTTFAAKALPTQPGVSGWVAIMGPLRPFAKLQSTVNADVAIIGGGFAGLSAARRLLQIDPKLRVTVLDAAGFGDGPSGRNSGFMIDLPHDFSSENYGRHALERERVQIDLYRHAIAFARQLAEQRQLDESVFDLSGKYNIAVSDRGDKHNREYSHYLDTLNEGNKLVGAKDIALLTGSNFFTSAVYTPAAAVLQPAAYIRALADDVAERGSLFENSPVTSFEREGRQWRLKTPSGTVSAEKIILANNGHVQSFGFFPRQLMHVFTYASMTHRFDPNRLGGERKWAATPAHPVGTTVRRVPGVDGDRILIRSRYTYNPSMTVSDAAINRASRLHERKFAVRFPMLLGLRMEYRWAGHMCLSLNGVPAFGEIAQGLYSACCCNGLGVSKSTAAGMAAAELALGVDSPVTRAMSAEEQPKALPPEPFATIGGKAYLKLREWNANSE